MRNVLMIAFHFPPAAMGSGHLRTLGFARHLPALGWNPIVLSANAGAYPKIDKTNEELIPRKCEVHRTIALDAQRHFGVAGKYPAWLAKPDRWVTWWPTAVWQGLRLVRRHHIHAIWSTYPIMTSHMIADALHSRTNLPWIADFRDPVTASVSKTNAFALEAQQRIERRVLTRAAHVTLTTTSAMNSYAERYPDAWRDARLSVISNGYEESVFSGIPAVAARPDGRLLRFVHSGVLYPDGRDPVPFFAALAKLKAAGTLDSSDVKIVLRASGSDAAFACAMHTLGVEDMVELAPPVPNQDALREQAEADGLLLLQGERFDRQIPAKAYEYLRIGRPIFALVGEHGDTATLLRQTGGAEIVPLNDVDAIVARFAAFVASIRTGAAPRADVGLVAGYSRSRGAALLAGLLDRSADSSEQVG